MKSKREDEFIEDDGISQTAGRAVRLRFWRNSGNLVKNVRPTFE